MRTHNHSTAMQPTCWRHRAQLAGGVVVRPVADQASVVVVASITRIADAKPAPSGQERGVP